MNTRKISVERQLKEEIENRILTMRETRLHQALGKDFAKLLKHYIRDFLMLYISSGVDQVYHIVCWGGRRVHCFTFRSQFWSRSSLLSRQKARRMHRSRSRAEPLRDVFAEGRWRSKPSAAEEVAFNSRAPPSRAGMRQSGQSWVARSSGGGSGTAIRSPRRWQRHVFILFQIT